MCLTVSFPAKAADPFAGESSSFYATLDDYARDKRGITVISDRIDEVLKVEPQQLPLAFTWAKNKAIGATDPSKVNGLYFMPYSDLARRTARGLPKTGKNFAPTSLEALQALLIFEAITAADFARCKSAADKTVLPWIVEPRAKMLDYVYGLLTPQEIEAVWTNALNMEAATGARPANTEVCSNQLAVDMTYGDHPQAKVTPEFISAPEWEKLRASVREKTLNGWKLHYSMLPKAQ